VVKQGVPIFKSHQRTDPATGQLIRVDLPKLYRIANKMAGMEREGGVPIRMTLGHTEPGKPETQQPPVAGYYRNPRVQAFGPKGEPAIVVDEYLDPQYGQVRKNYPYRSAEYYDDAEQITGVALLTRDPYLDLGVVAYEKGGPSVITYGPPSQPPVLYDRHGGTRRPTMYNLTLGEARMDQNQVPQVPGAVTIPQQVPPGVSDTIPQGPQPTHYAQPTHYNPALLAGMAGRFGSALGGAGRGAAGALGGGGMGFGSAMNLGSTLGSSLGGMGGGAGAGAGGGEPPDQNAAMGAPTGYTGGTWNAHGGWDASYHRPSMHRQHPSGGAVYSNSTSSRPASSRPASSRPPHSYAGSSGPASRSMSGPPSGSASGPASRSMSGPPSGGPGSMGGPPSGGPGGPGGPSGGPEQALMTVLEALQVAQDALGQLLGGGSGGPGGPGGGPPGMPPSGPPGGGPGMPPPGGMGGPGSGPPMGPSGQAPQSPFPPDDSQPYSRGSRRNFRHYSNPEDPMQPVRQAPTHYGAAQPQNLQGQAPGGDMRTITGRPVGQYMREQALQYQIDRANEAIRILMYERDQSDTQWCIAEVSKLAQAGYNVGEFEVSELKKRNPAERADYINHIATHYSRVGTDVPPPILGDPTPGPADPTNRPISREEMEAALNLKDHLGRPIEFTQAIHYIRQSQAGGTNRIAMYGAPGAVPAPGVTQLFPTPIPGAGPTDFYPEPSANGHGN
jgi:hypothetical protein